MSKYLSVPYGNYNIAVQDGGTIRLDTGVESGRVEITGNLWVQGTTTTIDTVEMTVEDNIIELSYGHSNDGLPTFADGGRTSGIRINRGSKSDALFVFDENVSWDDTGPGTGVSSGAFNFKNASGDPLGLQTNFITTQGGGNLYLISKGGSGVLSVEGTTNYEENVFVYTGPNTIDITGGPDGIGVLDADYIPNAQGLADYMSSFFASVFQTAIEQGDTRVATEDEDETSVESRVKITVDGIVSAEFFSNRFVMSDLQILGNEISTNDAVSNNDLILSANGTGTVKIKDVIEITETPGDDDSLLDPSASTEGIKIYSKTEDKGGTGLYFVNSSITRDELICNNRSLLYSMLF